MSLEDAAATIICGALDRVDMAVRLANGRRACTLTGWRDADGEPSTLGIVESLPRLCAFIIAEPTADGNPATHGRFG